MKILHLYPPDARNERASHALIVTKSLLAERKQRTVEEECVCYLANSRCRPITSTGRAEHPLSGGCFYSEIQAQSKTRIFRAKYVLSVLGLSTADLRADMQRLRVTALKENMSVVLEADQSWATELSI